MLTTLLAAGLILGGGPVVVQPKIVAASLFKNGYAVVVREAPLNTSGETYVATTPSSALGTVWFSASDGAKLTEVVATRVSVGAEAAFNSLDEVLQGNVGKKVTIAINPADPVLGGSRSGTLVSASGTVVVLKCEKDTIALQKTAIVSVTGAGDDMLWKTTVKSETRALRIKSTGPKDGKLYVVSLERGIMWAPAYSVDISNGKNLKLTAKATVLNDLGNLDNVDIRLVTGFPNVPFVGTPDPLTGDLSLDQFVGLLMRVGTPSEYRATAGGIMTQNAAGYEARGSFDAAFPSEMPSEKVEDLFFYKQPGVTLAQGERAYYLVFSIEAPYEHIYTWDVEDAPQVRGGLGGYSGGSSGVEGPGDVWHCLRFKNTGKQPFTTAPASTFKEGSLLGQDILNYVSPGAEAQVRITKALDIRAEKVSEEVSRERGAVKRSDGRPLYDLVTVKETLQIGNRRSETSKLQIKRTIEGEIVQADRNPVVVKSAANLKDVNVHERIEWTVEVKPAETVKIEYTYKVYVPTAGLGG